jgi:Dimethlysulfonioproprionate lyase
LTQRSPDLQSLLALAEAAIHQAPDVEAPVHSTAARVFEALRAPSTQASSETARLPVCRHLPAALEHARRQPGPVGALADAFARIEPILNWQIRPGAETLGEPFLNGHANATIIGPEGLEVRHDVRVGVSLMAPHTRYPDHRHPPEENTDPDMNLSIHPARAIHRRLPPSVEKLSSGLWRQADRPWHEPGIGGLVYNPPNIVHAMRAREWPLLALWFLWTEPEP